MGGLGHSGLQGAAAGLGWGCHSETTLAPTRSPIVQMPAFKPNSSTLTPSVPAIQPESRSACVQLDAPKAPTVRPAGKYWVVVDESQHPADASRCYVYRNGTLLAQGHGRTGRDAFAEARRNARMARHCGL